MHVVVHVVATLLWLREFDRIKISKSLLVRVNRRLFSLLI